MAVPIFRHEKPPQIRMSAEAHSEKVVNLTFENVCRRPDWNHRIQNWRISVQAHCQANAFFLWNRKQVIDDFETRFLRQPVNAGQIGKKIERTVRIVT